MNPYDALGVKESDSLEQINHVYKDLMKVLHPDRANTAEYKAINMSPEERFKYLELIRKSYKQIMNIRQERNYPDYKQDYAIDEDMRINLNHTGMSQGDVNFASDANQSKFNMQFDAAQKRDLKAGMDDPNSRGYGEFASGKDFNQTGSVSMPGYSHDISVETPKTFARPDMKDNRIVSYIPESVGLSSTGLGHQELGLTSISDFGMTISGKGSIVGSDLNSVYGQNFENWETTVARDAKLSARFSNDTDVSKRLANLESTRGGIYDVPLDQKMMRAEMDRNALLASQERMKRGAMDKRATYYNDLNKGRIRNGVPHR